MKHYHGATAMVESLNRIKRGQTCLRVILKRQEKMDA